MAKASLVVKDPTIRLDLTVEEAVFIRELVAATAGFLETWDGRFDGYGLYRELHDLLGLDDDEGNVVYGEYEIDLNIVDSGAFQRTVAAARSHLERKL